MRNLFIHAYMAGNFGDDLMVEILCTRYPKTRFFLWAPKEYKERFRHLKNLILVSPESRLTKRLDRLIQKIAKRDGGTRKLLIKLSDASVHIGGSVFTQHFDDWSGFYGMDEQLLRLSKKLFVVGANFGPYTDSRYKEQYRELFRGYEDICFRDSASKREFPEMKNIRWAPDVVFTCQDIPEAAEKKQVLFSVIELGHRGGKYPIYQYQESYERFLASWAEEFSGRGYTVKFVSFCRLERDEEAMTRILNRMRPEVREKVGTVCYNKNRKECMEVFAESEIIIGTRFHSIILGMLLGKRVVPIIYNGKTRNMLADAPCGIAYELEDFETLSPAQAADQAQRLARVESGELRSLAQKQFEALDQFLGLGR